MRRSTAFSVGERPRSRRDRIIRVFREMVPIWGLCLRCGYGLNRHGDSVSLTTVGSAKRGVSSWFDEPPVGTSTPCDQEDHAECGSAKCSGLPRLDVLNPGVEEWRPDGERCAKGCRGWRVVLRCLHEGSEDHLETPLLRCVPRSRELRSAFVPTCLLGQIGHVVLEVTREADLRLGPRDHLDDHGTVYPAPQVAERSRTSTLHASRCHQFRVRVSNTLWTQHPQPEQSGTVVVGAT